MKSLIGGVAEALNKTPVPYVSRALSALPLHSNNPTAQMRALGSVGTLFAIVGGLTEAEMQVNWRLYRKARSGKKEDREEVTRHAALDLWNGPNQFYSRQEFVEATGQHQELVGEQVWVVAYNPAAPTLPLELWPVRPDRIEPIPHPEQFLSHYVYKGPNGERVRLELNEVIHIKLPNPLDPYRGMGPVQSLLADLDSARYSAEWNRNFFLNGAEPGGIVESPTRLSDPEFEEFTSRWREQHQGVANAHRVALLEKMTWKERKFSMRDMQFAELRRVSSEIIREAFRFPKPLLGTVTDVNRANAEAAEVMFARWLVVPRCERRKGTLNSRFLPLFGREAARDLEFDYDDVIPDDKEADNAERDSRANAAKLLVDAGYDPDEVLEAVGLPQITFIGRAASAAEPPPFAHAGGHSHALPAMRAQDENVLEEIATQLDEVQNQWEWHLDRLVAGWDSISAAQRAELRDQIQAAVDNGNLAALSQLMVSSEQGAELLADAMVAIAGLSASLTVREAADQDVAIEPAQVDEERLGVVAGAVAAMLAAGLALTAGREALRVAGPGRRGGEVADDVDEVLAGLSDRALRDHLGGALSTAQNAGRVDTMREALRAVPVTAFYASEQNDRNTCGPCRAVHGRWLGNNEPGLDLVDRTYPSGGYVDCEGGVRCRGTVVAVYRPEQVSEGGEGSAAS